VKPQPPFEDILNNPQDFWEGPKFESLEAPPDAGKLSRDNKIGMILLNRLMAMNLQEKDRVFVTSLQRQILAKRPGFGMTEKQWKWLHDICRRMGLRKDAP
jgi:hypothetical protein